jgi:hypothetical protein
MAQPVHKTTPKRDLKDPYRLAGDPTAGYAPRPDLSTGCIWIGTQHHVVARLDTSEARLLIAALIDAVRIAETHEREQSGRAYGI